MAGENMFTRKGKSPHPHLGASGTHLGCSSLSCSAASNALQKLQAERCTHRRYCFWFDTMTGGQNGDIPAAALAHLEAAQHQAGVAPQASASCLPYVITRASCFRSRTLGREQEDQRSSDLMPQLSQFESHPWHQASRLPMQRLSEPGSDSLCIRRLLTLQNLE